MNRRGRHLFYFIVILCLILAEIFTIKHLVSKLKTYEEVETVSFEPVVKFLDIRSAAEECCKSESFPRTHDFAETVDISQEDAQLLMDVAFAEAGNQGSDGQWLVMSVVMNRVESEAFPDTISEVVYQKHQFATATNGAISEAEPTTDTHYALARIENGDVASQIIAFETTESVTLDSYFSPAFVYRGHQFYTEKH